MLELRDYQEECVKRVVGAYEKDRAGRELLVLPCGTGKTVIFSHVINALARAYGLNALIVAHRDELLDQAADKYRMVKPEAIIGKVGSGFHQYGGEVTVASIATISRPEHLKRLKAIGYGLVIVDEAHHVAAAGYQAVLQALPEAFVLLVTATSDRLDGKPLMNGKPPLYEASILDMIADGYLCDVKAVAIKTEVDLSELHTEMGDFNEKELEDAVDTPARNNLIVRKYLELTPGKRAVAFCVTVAHATHLAEAFLARGVNAAVIEGGTDVRERKRIYKTFRAGDITVLANVMVLSEGWDEPLCEVGIGARPTQSRALFVQQFGRILRLAPGKPYATWLEVTDNCLKHRLEPQRLSKVLRVRVRDGETVSEAVARDEAEKQTVVRRLQETRQHDMPVNVLAKLTWVLNDKGAYVLTVGLEKHRIALIPCKGAGDDLWGNDGYYAVWARLSPRFEAQQWSGAMPLDYAQQIAERKARELLADASSVRLIDRTASWRNDQATETQIEKITKYVAKGWIKADIPTDEAGNYQLTKGEAGDLLDPVFQMFARWDAQKKARSMAG